MELVAEIFKICIIPLLGILTKYLVDFLSAKAKQLKESTDDEIAQKYLDMLLTTVRQCVITTNQTYVDALKAEGKFDKEAQEIAFNKTLDAVLSVLSEDAKQYITELTGDLNTYLVQLIESEVHYNKK